MFFPNQSLEKKLHRQGYEHIAGLDEVGRGAWAGPLVAAAVILPPELKLIGLRDSKLLSPNQRNRLFLQITRQAVSWGIGLVSEKIIDVQGLTFANKLALTRAFENLTIAPHYLLIDAVKLDDQSIPQQNIIRGDREISIIAAASIIAKVFRDYLLTKFAEQYPQYGFGQHKGYGTRQHYEMICQHGVCAIHRKSFKPIMDRITYNMEYITKNNDPAGHHP